MIYGISYRKMTNKNFSILLFVLLAIATLLLLRFLPVGIWPWVENFLVERLHLSRQTVTAFNISIWIIGASLILLVWLKKKKAS